jgi:very-short-patch-repair endonuclease
MAVQVSTVEGTLARSGARAHGVVDRRELLAAGISRDEIQHRLDVGMLIPEFRGIYRVGHAAPSTDAHYLAAVRACGEDALLCGLAAAHTHGLVKGRAPAPDVTAPMARACHEAGVRYGTTPRHVEVVLQRRPNTPGARHIRRVMSGDAKIALSKLERAFIELLKAHGFPLPETNRVAGGRRVDCRWPDHHLTVELDGYRFHNSRHSWEQGLQREREARARGDEFRRFSYDDVFENQRYMLVELGKLLPR